jgi:hypothetical protein
MKRLLLISLTAILGIGSLANVASAHPDQQNPKRLMRLIKMTIVDIRQLSGSIETTTAESVAAE